MSHTPKDAVSSSDGKDQILLRASKKNADLTDKTAAHKGDESQQEVPVNTARQQVTDSAAVMTTTRNSDNIPTIANQPDPQDNATLSLREE
jgi:hypothetical protein